MVCRLRHRNLRMVMCIERYQVYIRRGQLLDKDSPKRKRVWDKQAQMYWQQLTRLGAETVISMLHDGDVLLGWHGKQSECFRSVLAEFLRRNGIDVEEI